MNEEMRQAFRYIFLEFQKVYQNQGRIYAEIKKIQQQMNMTPAVAEPLITQTETLPHDLTALFAALDQQRMTSGE